MQQLKWHGYTAIANARVPKLLKGVYVIYNKASALNTLDGYAVDIGQGDISDRLTDHKHKYPNAYVTWTAENDEHIRKRIEKFLQRHYELQISPDLYDIDPMSVIPPV